MRVIHIALITSFLAGNLLADGISSEMFRHHYITRDVPGKNVGTGSPALADFDQDGDLDFAFYNRGDGKLYWFENTSADDWKRHLAGDVAKGQLGCVTKDIDGDGFIDIVIGGYWYRNPGKPRTQPFERYSYDSLINREIHDMVLADVDGDGEDDLVVTGDDDGCFWYTIPAKPVRDFDWPRVTITMAVRVDRVGIHSGLNPGGVNDLDGDGDADVMLTDRWYENTEKGVRWIEHRILYGKNGPWALSSRSWITDVDGDGDNDVIAVDSDGQNSAAAWIENQNGKMTRTRVHYLANRAPGTRGSFHSLQVADFDADGDDDILVVEQEDPYILPLGATPRWFIFENLGEAKFAERVILDARLGGHDAIVGDIDGDGDLDIASKVWNSWDGNAVGGKVHADWLENLTK